MPRKSDHTLIIGSHPRDDVWRSWKKDGHDRSGIARIFADGAHGTIPTPDSEAAGQVELYDLRTAVLEPTPGRTFTAVIEAGYDGEAFTKTAVFRITGDEADVTTVTVGPGVTTESGRWGRRRHGGFEFGVLVMGAVVVAEP